MNALQLYINSSMLLLEVLSFKLHVHRPILQQNLPKNCLLILLGHKIYWPILLLTDFYLIFTIEHDPAN